MAMISFIKSLFSSSAPSRQPKARGHITTSYAKTGGNGQSIDFSLFEREGTYHYLTKRNQLIFDFELKYQPDGRVFIFIVNQPAYPSNRATDGHSSHRLACNGRKYVCCASDNWPRNIPDALSWLQYWSEWTDFYMDTGKGVEQFDMSVLG